MSRQQESVSNNRGWVGVIVFSELLYNILLASFAESES